MISDACLLPGSAISGQETLGFSVYLATEYRSLGYNSIQMHLNNFFLVLVL